jgi:hypothetical protein
MRDRLVFLVDQLTCSDLRQGEPLDEKSERVGRQRGEQTVAPVKVGGL